MIARVNSPFPHKRRCAQIGSRCGRVSAYVMRISPVGFQRMRELKKCHKQDIFLTERKIPFARDPSLREGIITRSHFFFQTDEIKSREGKENPTFAKGSAFGLSHAGRSRVRSRFLPYRWQKPQFGRAQKAHRACLHNARPHPRRRCFGNSLARGGSPFCESRVSGK